MSGSTPQKDINWVTTDDVASPWSCSPGQDRRVPGFRARAAGAARPQDRPRDRRHGDGPAMVPVLLLHVGRKHGLRPTSIRSRPSARCAPSSRPLICARPSRSVPRGSWSRAASRSLRYALQTMTDVPYNSLARARPEDTLRFYALRLHEVGMINSTPNTAHRRGHRLALPQRAQARAEGVSQARAARPGGLGI